MFTMPDSLVDSVATCGQTDASSRPANSVLFSSHTANQPAASIVLVFSQYIAESIVMFKNIVSLPTAIFFVWVAQLAQTAP